MGCESSWGQGGSDQLPFCSDEQQQLWDRGCPGEGTPSGWCPGASSGGTELASESHRFLCGLRHALLHQLSVLPPLCADPGDGVSARQAERLPIEVTEWQGPWTSQPKECKVTI